MLLAKPVDIDRCAS